MRKVPLLEQWRASGQWLKYQGQRIFCVTRGSGPPILFLHGFPTASYDYVHLAPLLENDYQLLFFDFLGFGFSDKPRPHTYSLFEQADIAAAAAAHFGVPQVYLVTHDMGSSVGLELLRRETPTVKKLVMLNGSVLLDHYRPLITQRLLLHPILGPLITRFKLIRRPAFKRQFGSLFPKMPPENEIDDFWALICYKDGMRIYDRLIQYLNERKIHQHTWLDALQAHSAPLTVIWGQRDPVSVPQIAEAILQRRPDAHYLPLHNIGHYPQWETPQHVAALIREAFG